MPAYFRSNLQCLLNMKRPEFKQSRTLLFLSSIFLFCPSNIFRLSDIYPATSQKILGILQTQIITALKEQSDQGPHCMLIQLGLLEAFRHGRILEYVQLSYWMSNIYVMVLHCNYRAQIMVSLNLVCHS